MRYAELKTWVTENPAHGQKVEKIVLAGTELRIRFKGDPDLAFWISRPEGFCFFGPRTITQAGTEIWPQLCNAALVRIGIEPDDRILYFDFESRDIYQEQKRHVLVAEFTPPRPNLILCGRDDAGLTILDALDKYSYADNPQRQVLPRLPYQKPSTCFSVTDAEVTHPLVVKPVPGGEGISCFSANEYFRLYLERVIIPAGQRQGQQSLKQRWSRVLKRAEAKLAKQRAEAADAEKAEYWRICAECLKPLLNQIKPGSTEIRSVNYFDPELKEILIPLQPDRSPQENLQHYVRKYRKAMRGKQIIEKNIAATEQVVVALNDILQRIEAGDTTGLEGEKNLGQVGKKLELSDKLLRLRVDEEFEIVIGRKARENDFIVTQLSRPHDWWFHSRIYHGAHVLLRCLSKKDPGPGLAEACCSLAAWYSKAKFSQNVPVDYTQARYLRKPRRSAPGFVTYTNHQTCFAAPRDLRSVREELSR
jgi:predicted ribosome quality control (RQC) complex YloA/Tae2 family protein